MKMIKYVSCNNKKERDDKKNKSEKNKERQ